MKYRELGSTGLKVSEISLGCEGFVANAGSHAQALVDEAILSGINYIDLYTPNPDVHRLLGKALQGRREQFMIQAHLCTTWQDGQYKRTRNIDEVRVSFEDLLHRLGTTYVEVGMIHYVDALDDWRGIVDGTIMRYATELKAAGAIKHIGISSHNPVVSLEAIKSNLVEVLMFSVNPLYDLLPASEDCMELFDDKSYERTLVNIDPDRESLYETCSRLGVGITVMKAFGGGDLLDATRSPAGIALTANQCLHYALTRPGVASVVAGAHTLEELKTCLRYEDATETEKDYASSLAGLPRVSWQGHCMYCGHCAPCTAGIDVATVTKYLKLAQAQGAVPETVREHYSSLPHRADQCTQCGICESRCPFGVSVRENMKMAQRVFGK